MSQPLYHREKDPSTQWIGDWVGPGASLDAVTKRKIPYIAPAGNQTLVI